MPGSKKTDIDDVYDVWNESGICLPSKLGEGTSRNGGVAFFLSRAPVKKVLLCKTVGTSVIIITDYLLNTDL